ncbi:MAG: GAF domain-containing protein [Chloroflexi bacterium]|nr:GAF domain-containing protein [Chloroflexota bacterium]
MSVEHLYRLARALHQQKLDLSAVLQTAVTSASALFGAPHGCILLVNASGRVTDMRLNGTQLDPKVELEFWLKMLNEGVIRSVLQRRRPSIVPNISADATWPLLPHLPSLRWRGSAAAIPLLNGDILIGVLALIHPQVDAFTDHVITELLETGEVITEALANVLSHDAMQRRYTQMLREAESEDETMQLRHDLTAMIYHDLRAPLHNIHTSLGTLEMMLHASDPTTTEKLLRIAMQSSRRLIRMVKSLLDIDRLEAGRAVLHKKTTSFPMLFNDMMTSVKPLAEEADQSLTISIDDHVPNVVVDHDMILRVIINLVENAIKHTPPGGEISVSVGQRHGGEVVVSISDTGPGIPASFRLDVFDKYFRIRNTERSTIEEMRIGAPVQETPDVSTRGGLGLGLAFCRLAIEAHNGRIWVEDAPGGGATFAFSLPSEAAPEPERVLEMS